jgi:hypothetical protein
MSHNHEGCCEHQNVKFCKKCGVPYCMDCGKEWYDRCEINHDLIWYYTPYVYTTPSISSPWITSVTTYVGTTNCNHES